MNYNGNESCFNTEGSFECKCNDGFTSVSVVHMMPMENIKMKMVLLLVLIKKRFSDDGATCENHGGCKTLKDLTVVIVTMVMQE